MRLNFVFILVVLFLSFGYANTVSTKVRIISRELVPETEIYSFEANREKLIELKLENGSVVNCSIQAKTSAFQNLGNGKLAVSINSNWICK